MPEIYISVQIKEAQSTVQPFWQVVGHTNAPEATAVKTLFEVAGTLESPCVWSSLEYERKLSELISIKLNALGYPVKDDGITDEDALLLVIVRANGRSAENRSWAYDITSRVEYYKDDKSPLPESVALAPSKPKASEPLRPYGGTRQLNLYPYGGRGEFDVDDYWGT